MSSIQLSRREGGRPLSGLEKVRRVLGAAGRGAEAGSVSGVLVDSLLRKRSTAQAPLVGAVVGAVTNGALQYRRDKQRDLAARVSTILLQDRAALRRLTDAVGNNVDLPVPGANEAQLVVANAKRPIVRRVGARLLKIGAGATLGHYAGRKIGARAGTIAGAVAGALFESSEVRGTVQLSVKRAMQYSVSQGAL